METNKNRNKVESCEPYAVPAKELTSHQIEAWSSLVNENQDLASPFFAPDYTLAVAAVVPEVRVGIIECAGEPVAFLPFEQKPHGIGYRLRLCDYQALIAKPGFDFDIRKFIKNCGLRAWDFDHLLASQEAFRPFHRGLGASPVIDLSGGFAAYVVERRAAGTEQIKKAGNLTRRLEREVGPLRFESHLQDPAILRQLLTWRAAKYQDSRHSFESVESILTHLLEKQNPDCRGTLSVLYAGSEIAAIHFGLRSRRVWHYWFPAYNPCFEKYSPGTILLLRIAELTPTLGMKIVDLGKGDQDYKRRLMNGSIGLAEGSVETSLLISLPRASQRSIRKWAENKPTLLKTARSLAQIAKRIGFL